VEVGMVNVIRNAIGMALLAGIVGLWGCGSGHKDDAQPQTKIKAQPAQTEQQVSSDSQNFLSHFEGLWKSQTGAVYAFYYRYGVVIGVMKNEDKDVRVITLEPNGDYDAENHMLPLRMTIQNRPGCNLQGDITDTGSLPAMEVLNAPSGTSGWGDDYLQESADIIHKASKEVDYSNCLPQTNKQNLSLKNGSLDPEEQFLPQLVSDEGKSETFAFIRKLNATDNVDQRVIVFNERMPALVAAVKKAELDRAAFLNDLAVKLEAKRHTRGVQPSAELDAGVNAVPTSTSTMSVGSASSACVFRARKAIDSRQAGPWFRAMSVHCS
jgi:hypothetical protein